MTEERLKNRWKLAVDKEMLIMLVMKGARIDVGYTLSVGRVESALPISIDCNICDISVSDVGWESNNAFLLQCTYTFI